MAAKGVEVLQDPGDTYDWVSCGYRTYRASCGRAWCLQVLVMSVTRTRCLPLLLLLLLHSPPVFSCIQFHSWQSTERDKGSVREGKEREGKGKEGKGKGREEKRREEKGREGKGRKEERRGEERRGEVTVSAITTFHLKTIRSVPWTKRLPSKCVLRYSHPSCMVARLVVWSFGRSPQ